MTGPHVPGARILVVSGRGPARRVGTICGLLARRLASRGIRYSAYAFGGSGEKTGWTFCDELIEGPVPTLAQVLISGRYDLLHCVDTAYSPPYGVETWVRRARFRGPIVLSSQSSGRKLSELAHATRYVACSADAAGDLALDADGEVVVIPNGFDEEVFHPGDVLPGRRPLLVWVGPSSDTWEGIWLFLDGLESLPDHDAVIVDTTIDSREAEVVRGHVQTFGSRVRHVGPVSPRELAELLRTAAGSGGAFVCTGRYASFPISMSEAMACMCPVVVRRTAGLRDLEDGRNVIAFDRALGTSALVEAVERSRDPAVRSRVVRGGLDAAAGRSSAAMAEAYLRVYEDALAAVPGPTLVQRATDPVARSAWRLALHARPLWHRRPRLLGSGTRSVRADSKDRMPGAVRPRRIRVESQAPAGPQAALRYLLVVLTHGASPHLDAALSSFRTNVYPQPVHGLLWIDGPDEGDVAVSVVGAGHPDWTVSGGEPQQGFCAAVASAWAAAVTIGAQLHCTHVFWLEGDFVFDRGVDLRPVTELLEREPGIAQVSLMRNAVFPDETAAGGLYEAHHDEYEPRRLVVERDSPEVPSGSYPYLTQRSYYTGNPNLMRLGFMAEHPWRVAPPGCEWLYTHELLAAGFRFGVWGNGEPWVTHMGGHDGFGY